MPEADARQELRRANLAALKDQDGQVILYNSAAGSGTVTFTKGRLTSASRDWSVDKASSQIATIIMAFQALAARESENCSIQSDPIHEPKMNLERVFIKCGLRSLLLMSGNISGEPTYQISEQINSPITDLIQ
jgi:precorrin-6B methylase 2